MPATATPDPTPTATPTKTTTQVTLTSPGAGSLPNFQVTWMKPTTMYTTGVAIVRDAPNSDGTILTTDTTATAVTVYGKTTGEVVAGVSTWYRVSGQGSAPQYIYGGRLSSNKPAPSPSPTPGPVLGPPPPPPPAPPAPVKTGKVMLVNLTSQYLYAYDNGAVVRVFPITSGRPELRTPTGNFTVLSKGANLTFYSPWPPSSPYYYSPEHVDFALKLTTSGIYIHTAGWREYNDFGPGTEYPHTLPDGTKATGSHGCVNTRIPDGQWYYNWAPVGMPVVITY